MGWGLLSGWRRGPVCPRPAAGCGCGVSLRPLGSSLGLVGPQSPAGSTRSATTPAVAVAGAVERVQWADRERWVGGQELAGAGITAHLRGPVKEAAPSGYLG